MLALSSSSNQSFKKEILQCNAVFSIIRLRIELVTIFIVVGKLDKTSEQVGMVSGDLDAFFLALFPVAIVESGGKNLGLLGKYGRVDLPRMFSKDDYKVGRISHGTLETGKKSQKLRVKHFPETDPLNTSSVDEDG